MQLKLDELIRATRARNAFVNLEDLTDEELVQLNEEFKDIHDKSGHSSVMKKLHESIELEHVRRKTMRNGGRINSLIGRVRQGNGHHHLDK